MLKNKVNLFLIGASKCGTTSLWNMLSLHPDVFMSTPKEPFFFSFSDYRSRFDSYHELFENVNTERYLGEATPIYSETTLIPDLTNRLYKYNPEAKIIFLVRNPIDRLKSAWRQLLYTGHDRRQVYKDYCDVDVPKMPKSFLNAIYEYPNFIEATKYWTHLSNYLKVFPKENIGVFFFEDLKDNPKSFLNTICDFLEIEFHFQDQMLEIKNPSLGRKRDNELISFLKSNKFMFNAGTAIKNLFNLDDEFMKKEINYQVELRDKEKAKILEVLQEEIDRILDYTNKPSDYWQQ